LSATVPDEATVDLAWTGATDNVAVAGYRILRDGTVVATLPAAATTYQDTGLARSTTYAYQVVAVDTSGNQGLPASTIVEVGPPDEVAPTAASDFVATGISATSVRLTWTGGTDDIGVAGYRIWRNGVAVTTVAGTTWTDTRRAPKTSFTYQVATLDRAGNASAVAIATGTTLRDTTRPSTPGTLRRRTYAYRVALSWKPRSTDNVAVARYLIYRVGRSAPVASAIDPWRMVRRIRGARYYVRAIDTSGNVSYRTNIVTLW
jgi:chitodextrinase